jgi:murein DD-endopeptidase MepM/ murein hydrolase activator NlpD
MRGWLGGLALLLAACAKPTDTEATPAQQQEQAAAVAAAEAPPPAAVEAPPAEPQAPPPPARTNRIDCAGPATQGGAILCRTDPGAELALDGKPIAIADDEGLALVGLTRSQSSPAAITFVAPLDIAVPFERRSMKAEIEVLKRTDTVSKFAMDCKKIAPQSPEDKRHAEVSWVKKANALKSFNAPLAPFGLIKPAEGAYSSPYGATRSYIPKTSDCEGSTRVHNGQDIAIGTGTEIHAPMAGTVILADPDLFYEGGCVFLDLGRGLISVTMHMSRLDVKAGDRVEQGQLLGLSGSTGSVTGPHLHWALKYRNVTSDDRGTDIWLDPMLLLKINSAQQ